MYEAFVDIWQSRKSLILCRYHFFSFPVVFGIYFTLFVGSSDQPPIQGSVICILQPCLEVVAFHL